MRWYHLIVVLILYPFAQAGLIWLAAMIKSVIIRNMKNGWLKDNLLRERWQSSSSNSHRRVTGGKQFLHK